MIIFKRIFRIPSVPIDHSSVQAGDSCLKGGKIDINYS